MIKADTQTSNCEAVFQVQDVSSIKIEVVVSRGQWEQAP